MAPVIATSILSADFSNLQTAITMINESVADWIHVDVMDGQFVPNISFGIPIMEALKKHSKKPLDVHLMIVEPANFVEKFAHAGADHISVHVEVCSHLHRIIQQIKNLGVQAGVALNPHTPIQQIENIISEIDLVCLMSVNPGFGGQKFIDNTFQKIKTLKELIRSTKSTAKIKIDGGVNLENSKALIDAGADILVAGHCIFSSKNPLDTTRKLKG